MVKENKKRSTNTRVKKKEHSIAYFDYSLLAILICLICFGLVMLYSTSSYSAMMKQNGDITISASSAASASKSRK